MHLLLLALMACTPPPCADGYGRAADGNCWPLATGDPPDCDDTDETGQDTQETDDTDDPQETGDTGDTGEPDPTDPWNQPGYWEEGSLLDAVLGPDPSTPSDTWEVRMNVSTDGWMTSGDYEVVAHGFSSLDLLLWGDALILLGGMDLRSLDLGEEGETIRWGYLYALTTTDLETWGTHLWPVEDAESGRMTDPSLQLLSDGRLRAVYYSTPLDAEGDPAWIEGPHPIKMAWRDGDVFRETAEAIYSDEGLVDPVVCEHQGTHHFYSTKSGEITHATSASGDNFVRDEGFTWGGNQVPYCWHDDEDQLRVVGQIGGGMGTPSYRILQDDGTYTDPTFLYDDPSWFGGNCSSPVLARFKGLYVTFCASWPG